MASEPGRESSRLRRILLVALGAAIVGSALFLDPGDWIGALRDRIAALGPLGPAAFVLLFALATTLAVPASLLTVAAGALFGSVVGVVTVIAGATLGASASFALARWLARDLVAGWLGRSRRFAELDRLTEEHGAIVVALTRLVPIFPFNLLNYGFGLTRVPFGTYVLWTFLCMLPGTVLVVVGADAFARALEERRMPWGLVAVFAATLVVISILAHRARISLAAKSKPASEPAPPTTP